MNWVSRYIRRNPIQAAVQFATVVLFVANIFLSIKLFPIIADIITIRLQVETVQAQVEKNSALLEKTSSNATEIAAMKQDIIEIKQTTIRLEEKFDDFIKLFVRGGE